MPEILVVDDDRAYLKATERVLLTRGFKVTLTDSPEQTLTFIKENPKQFDLILLDWKLCSALDGDAILLMIKRFLPDFNVPVIFVTAHTRISSKYLMRLGAYDTLEKPVSCEKLLDTVERALGEKAPEDPHRMAPAELCWQDLRKQALAKELISAIRSTSSLSAAAKHLGCSVMTLHRRLRLTGLHSFVVSENRGLNGEDNQ